MDYNKNKRKPMLFEEAWSGSSVELKNALYRMESKGIIDYDIAWNSNDGNYRNDGRYMYYKGELYCLDTENDDDYGSLPTWTQLHPSDLGWSYFSDELIDHSSSIPIRPDEWEFLEAKVDPEEPGDILVIIGRKSDGARLEISSPAINGEVADPDILTKTARRAFKKLNGVVYMHIYGPGKVCYEL